MIAIPRIARSIANPSAQSRHTAWMTKTSMSVSPAPIAAPTPANTRSAVTTLIGPRTVRPRNRTVARARRTRNPAIPTAAVGIPPTAEYGLSRTLEQLKYELKSHHDEPAAWYHCPARYPETATPA